MVELLGPTAADLRCESHLNHCVTMAESPSAAQRQLDLLAEIGDAKEMVRRLVDDSRISGRRTKA
jgi:hypothetical protein